MTTNDNAAIKTSLTDDQLNIAAISHAGAIILACESGARAALKIIESTNGAATEEAERLSEGLSFELVKQIKTQARRDAKDGLSHDEKVIFNRYNKSVDQALYRIYGQTPSAQKTYNNNNSAGYCGAQSRGPRSSSASNKAETIEAEPLPVHETTAVLSKMDFLDQLTTEIHEHVNVFACDTDCGDVKGFYAEVLETLKGKFNL